ncbi:baeRF3 domain-containing protein [Allorhodopirellula heiligendammensis]|uniref:Uncharacterized protein n=1 Tax=Allorhodopirellula heiligendammensis TaxID=2714739 RepID=A0A5C6BY74_9BACT|nr:hypothetical protein [Allorhodopirellula heiligendammensis]TWU16206.1 hypothetical protein Poly21_34110 [Allorhodopirellula heiligendammensis]
MTTESNETTFAALKPGDLKELASVSAAPCVSIMMGTHRSGRETQQGPIRLKNLLKEASEKLRTAGHDESILDGLASKTSESNFWQHQGEGLAIYLTTDDCRMFRLNRRVDEHVCVGKTFFVQPLIRESNAGGEYFVLSLSWDEASLYRATGDSLTPVETAALPAKFEELVLPRDPEESLQNTSHRSVGNTPGTSTAMFHGQGEGESKIEADRNQYLSLIGDEVAAAVYNTGLPLLVVATSEVTGHFEATTKVHVDAKVDGSPSEWSGDELREQAHKAIAPQLKADHDEFGERFGTALANSQGSDNLDDVLQAAKNGRVDSLMVCTRGEYCDQTNQAVVETLRNGGDVLQCRHEAMPGNDTVACAIFRF